MRFTGAAPVLMLISLGVLGGCQTEEEPYVPRGTLVTSTTATSQSVVGDEDEKLSTEEILAGAGAQPETE